MSVDASVLSLWACATPNRGGLDGNDLNDHGRAIFGCHGHLQSAGNASRPLYCPTRQLRRALLSCTRGTSSSSAPLTRSGTKLQLTLLAMMVVIFSICTHQLTAALGRHRVATRATAWSPGWLSPSHAGNRGSKPLRGAIFRHPSKLPQLFPNKRRGLCPRPPHWSGLRHDRKDPRPRQRGQPCHTRQV